MNIAIFLDNVVRWFGYIKHRLSEKSTWIAIGAGVTIASALSPPWSYVSVFIAAVAAMVPNG